jgi:glutamate-1-semialdehyde 2,1-aminomutase
MGLFFTDASVKNLQDVHATDRQRFTRVFHRLLGQGIHFPPSAYEALFLSTAHGDPEIDATVEAFDRALAEEA